MEKESTEETRLSPFSTPFWTHLYEGVTGGLCKHCGREEVCAWHKENPPTPPLVGNPAIKRYPAAQGGDAYPGDDPHKIYESTPGSTVEEARLTPLTETPEYTLAAFMQYITSLGGPITREWLVLMGYEGLLQTPIAPAGAYQNSRLPDYFEIGEDSDDVQIVYRFRSLVRGVHQIIHTKARTVESPAFEGDAMNEPRPASTIDIPERVEGFHVGDSFPLWSLGGEPAAAFWKWYQENR